MDQRAIGINWMATLLGILAGDVDSTLNTPTKARRFGTNHTHDTTVNKPVDNSSKVAALLGGHAPDFGFDVIIRRRGGIPLGVKTHVASFNTCHGHHATFIGLIVSVVLPLP